MDGPADAPEQRQGDHTQGRGGALVAVGVVTAIAALAVLGLVAWARLVEPDVGRGDAAAVDGPPGLLAGDVRPGPVPEPVAAAADGLVVGAAVQATLPDGAEGCLEGVAFAAVPRVERVVLTPEGLSASLVSSGSPNGPERASCNARWQDGRWRDATGEASGAAGGQWMSCCDGEGRATAFARLQAPDGAAWALQERDGWWLAYPVEGTRVVTVTWRFRPDRFGGASGSTIVLWVDDDGRVLEETLVRV